MGIRKFDLLMTVAHPSPAPDCFVFNISFYIAGWNASSIIAIFRLSRPISVKAIHFWIENFPSVNMKVAQLDAIASPNLLWAVLCISVL
jgi:hypothetical protein